MAAFVQASPAQAHNDLVSSVPAAGGTVSTVPSDATLVFSEALGTTGLQVAVTDGTGTAVPGLTAPRIDQATLAQALPVTLSPGGYTLAYRVVSVDGHPVGGTVEFTVAASAAPAPTTSPTARPTTSPATAPAPAGSPTATASGSGGAGSDLAVAPVVADVAGDTGRHWWWLLVALAVVLAVAVTLGWRPRRGRRSRPPQ